MNVQRKFLAEIDKVSRRPLPEEVLIRCRESLLDYIGVTYAGISEMSEREHELLKLLEGETGCGLAIGVSSNLPLKDAVFLNGLNGHALDFDDGVNAGIIHLGSPIFSLLIPLATKYCVSFDDLMRAAVLGYETAWTIAMSIQPGHKLHGYHATGTCGTLGATLAGAYLLGFDAEMRFQAFSTACVSASGMLKVLDDGSQLKPYNAAKAALMALISLQMAAAGFKGPDDALGGNRGFLSLMTGCEDVVLNKPLLDGKYAIMRTYTKPYAACRYCHPSIEAAVELGGMLNRDASCVCAIEVRTYDLAVVGHDHTEIHGSGSAKMSIPFGVAVGFLCGKASLDEYTDAVIEDNVVRGLTSKVRVFSDEQMSRDFPSKTTAEVRVVLNDGRILSKTVDFPKGEPENPLSKAEVCEKFHDMIAFGGMSDAFADSVIDCVFDNECELDYLLELLKQGTVGVIRQ